MSIRVWLLLIWASAAVATAAPAKVGEASRDFPGEPNTNWRGAEKHVLHVEIWYPAAASSTEAPQQIGSLFDAGHAAPNASLASAPKRFPFILLSHGTGGQALQLAWLAEPLARRGFIVAAVNHPGNNATDTYTAAGFALWWERARDMSIVLDRMLAEPTFGPRIDSSRIGAAGFSLGGYTVLELAGATTDWNAFLAFCKTHEDFCAGPPEFRHLRDELETAMKQDPSINESIQRAGASYRDNRIRAVFAIAPPLGVAFNPTDLARITIPVQLVVGDKDPEAPAKDNAQHFAQLIPHATLNILPGASHYTFLDVCTDAGAAKFPQLCETEPSAEREKFHDQVSAMAVAFFDDHLHSGHWHRAAKH